MPPRLALSNFRPIAALAPLTAAALVALPAGPVAAAEGGLEIFPKPFEMAYLMVFFLLLVWPANKLLIQPLLGVLDERRERIDGARKRAQTLEKDADGVLGEYEAAVNRARGDAEQARRGELDAARREESQLTAGARGEAEEEVGRAREEIQRASEDARQALRSEAEQLASTAAAQVLGRSLS